MKKYFIIATALLISIAVSETGCKKSGAPEAKSGAVFVDADGGLNMRKDPALNGELVALVPNGSAVTVLEEKDPVIEIKGIKGKWTKISWNDKTGWAFGGFLKAGSPSNAGGEIDTKDFIGKPCSFGEGPDGGSFTLQADNQITGSQLLGGSGDAKLTGSYTIAKEGGIIKVTVNGSVDTHVAAETDQRKSDKITNGQIIIKKENGKLTGSGTLRNFSVGGYLNCN